MNAPRIAFLATGFLLAVAVTGDTAAAVSEQLAARRSAGDMLDSIIGSRRDPVVERVQKALSRKKLYFGPIDGRYGPMTEDAVRRYQRETGLKVDGLITETLVNNLETADKIDDLLQKLDDARQSKMERDRQALLANPDTRDLVSDKADEVADPTRDPSACFASPTPQCLLAEAAESGKGVPRDNMRDWAMKELLVAQARAGLTQAAMATARRIVDPRLIMVALRDIAEALAASGFDAEALKTAQIIPDTVRKAEALTAIAGIWTERGKRDNARSALGGAAKLVDSVAKPLKKATFQADLAMLSARNGDGADAEARIKAAQDIALSPDNATQRSTALRHVAATLAEMGRQAEARNVMLHLDEDVDRTPILVATANAQIEIGDTDAAMKTAEEIPQPRYRAVVLADIAAAQAVAGHEGLARQTAARAAETAETIRMPFARSFAQGRIAAALTEAGGIDRKFADAIEAASAIKDDRIRAQSLWAIATSQRRIGDANGAERTRAKAEDAGKAIKSPLSRVWLNADLAVRYAAADNLEAARDRFDAAIAIARDIGNAWARTRALSRLAVALIEITDPDVVMPTPAE